LGVKFDENVGEANFFCKLNKFKFLNGITAVSKNFHLKFKSIFVLNNEKKHLSLLKIAKNNLKISASISPVGMKTQIELKFATLIDIFATICDTSLKNFDTP
jgi:hypothetical protein